MPPGTAAPVPRWRADARSRPRSRRPWPAAPPSRRPRTGISSRTRASDAWQWPPEGWDRPGIIATEDPARYDADSIEILTYHGRSDSIVVPKRRSPPMNDFHEDVRHEFRRHKGLAD